MKLSYDTKGINEASADFAPRLATFTDQNAAERFGHLFAASPELFNSLQELVNRCESYECEKWFPHVMERAKTALANAGGTNDI